MAEMFTIEGLVSLLALTSLEIILGIDNIIFIAIVCGRLPVHLREKARTIGLALAVITRIGLLMLLSFFIGLTEPLFSIGTHPVSVRELVLFLGGAFLIYKATHEIHTHVLHESSEDTPAAASGKGTSLAAVIGQILIVDLVFSFDSVITAVGVAKSKSVMVAAILIAVGVMLAFSGIIVKFISKYPTLKMLALSFILLIGVLLVMEGAGKEIERSYIYVAMAFSLTVEVANILRSNRLKVT